MSHEVGHNYGLGHYNGGFDGSVHRPADEINSSWGWDSQKKIYSKLFPIRYRE
jgi:predicted Zn-dependent protease